MANAPENTTQQLAETILRDAKLLQKLSDRVYELLQDDLRWQLERGLRRDRIQRLP